MREKEVQEVKDVKEEKEVIPEEKDYISTYGLKKFQFYLITFILFLIVTGCLFCLLPEKTTASGKNIFEFDYYFLTVILAIYTFFSFQEKASEVDIVRIIGLLIYTVLSINFFVPKLQSSLSSLDLSDTKDFLRIASSSLIILGVYPIIYFLGKWMFKRERQEEREKEKEEKEKE